MNEIKQKITLEVETRLKNAQEDLSSLQSYLNKLKVPDTLKESFRKSFNSINKEMDKVQSTLNKKTKTKGDVTGLERSFEKVDSEMGKILININKLQGKEVFTAEMLGTKEIDNTRQKLQQLIKDREALASKSKNNVDKAFQNFSASTGGAVARKEAIAVGNFIKEGDIEKAQSHLDALKIKVKELKEGTRKESYKTLISALQDEITSADPKLKKFDTDIKETKQTLTTLENARMDVLEKGLENAANGADHLRGKIGNLGKETEDLTEKQQQYTNEVNQVKDRVKYFFSLQNAIMLVRRALRSVINEMKALDSSMTSIAVVTNFSIGDMWDQMPTYTKMANELGVAIKSVYDASALWYQQGLKNNEVMQLTNETLKMARIAGMEASEATDRMTAA